MDLLHIHSYNTTSLFRHMDLLQEPGPHLRRLQETSLTGAQCVQVVKFLQEQGFRYNLTGLDPEQVRPTGGLGVIACAHYRVHALAPQTSAFGKISNNGRCQLVGIGLPRSNVLTIVNLYCWTGGHGDAEAAARTDDMFHVVFHELQPHPPGPKIILGHFNCDVEDLPVLFRTYQ